MTHENFSRTHDGGPGSERSFGLVIAGVLLAISFFPLLHRGQVRLYFFAPALLFAILALVLPRSLRILNHVWFRIGYLLQKITNPVFLGIIFFGLLAPIALFFRLTGRDTLGKTKDASSLSYWAMRGKEDGHSGDMQKQF